MPAIAPSDLVEAMKSDLASRLGIGPATVEVVSVDSVTWPDSSLGCPEPDQMYLQVLTDGYHVILQAGGTEYDYRADDRGHFRPCENP